MSNKIYFLKSFFSFLFLLPLLKKEVLNQATTRKLEVFKINNPNNSFNEAILEHNERVSFYQSKIKKWKNTDVVELINSPETLEIALKAKKDLGNTSGLKLKWKYFLNTCDFYPFKELIGEYLMEYLDKHPESNNEMFLNTIFLTYQVLYYKNASTGNIAESAEKYYNHIWFSKRTEENNNKNEKKAEKNEKNTVKTINKQVFRMKLPKNVESYYKNILPKKSFKGGSWFFTDKEKVLSKSLGIDLSAVESLNNIFLHIKNKINDDSRDFKSNPEYFFINKYKLDKSKSKPLNKSEIVIHSNVIESVKLFTSNREDFYNSFTFIVRTLQSTPIDFYGGRYQGKDKDDYEYYIRQVGLLSKNCLFVGPLVDLLDLHLHESKKLGDAITSDLEFTSFNDVNMYFSSKIEKNSIVRISYNFTLPNEKLLLEFRPELLFTKRLNPAFDGLIRKANNNSDEKIKSNNNKIENFDNFNDFKKNYDSKNSILPILSNKLDYMSINIPISKKDFSLNQYKLCKLISCGGSDVISEYLDDSKIPSSKILDYQFNISPYEINHDLYNLMRVYQMDDFISTIPIDDMEAFRNKFTLNKKVRFDEDVRALANYLDAVLLFDKKTKSYSYLLQDYLKVSSSLTSLEGFGNAVAEKLIGEYGNNGYIFKVALNNKSILYRHYLSLLEKIKLEVNDDLVKIKKEMLKSHVKN
jgi:hypothetical protein